MSQQRSSLLRGAAALALAAGSYGFATAAQAAAVDEQTETIVITGTKFNTDAAPAKASLATTEPQTIINKQYIDDFLAPTQDYNGILAIVPSMTGSDPAGPGLSDGGAKNTLRGFADGSFAMQYDGIPFGDANGPSHHSLSYFPPSAIGALVVDRGPGNAGNLGPATYGGTVKFFSPDVSPEFGGLTQASVGSFQTVFGNVQLQTGDVDALGKMRAFVSVQGVASDSALSRQNVETKNATLKLEDRISDNWKVTLFATWNYLKEHLSDNAGLTPAQVAYYGKNFALQDTNPNLPTYYAYNYTTKQTDMDYLKEQGDITDKLKVENTTYTYSYWNHTFSTNSQTQTLPQILANTSADTPGVTLLNGKKFATDLPAYDKVNQFRMYGDIIRASQDFNIGSWTGQVRVGAWLETADTYRYREFFDANLCSALGLDPFVQGRENVAQQCGITQSKAVVYGNYGFSPYEEHTSWQQYQPFMELEIKPTEDLTLTPGVKYVHWDHKTNSPVETKSLCGISKACAGYNVLGQNYQQSFVTTDTLPFFQANYKIKDNWSVYFEYAKGIYVPDITAFENSAPLAQGAVPAAQTSTNYQFGTVYYADAFTLDADVYYIPINNNFISVNCTVGGLLETCYQNVGQATYKGIEGQGTYAFEQIMGNDVKGLSVFANGALMSSKQQNGLWIKGAPKWTAAAGILFRRDGWRFGLIDKIVGPQYADNNQDPNYRMASYNDLSANAAYGWDRYEVEFNASNVLDSRKTVNISEGGTGTSLATSTDQYLFQAPLFMSVTVKARF